MGSANTVIMYFNSSNHSTVCKVQISHITNKQIITNKCINKTNNMINITVHPAECALKLLIVSVFADLIYFYLSKNQDFYLYKILLHLINSFSWWTLLHVGLLQWLLGCEIPIRTRGSGFLHVLRHQKQRNGLLCSHVNVTQQALEPHQQAGGELPPDHFLIELFKRTWETSVKPTNKLRESPLNPEQTVFSLTWQSSSRKRPKIWMWALKNNKWFLLKIKCFCRIKVIGHRQGIWLWC